MANLLLIFHLNIFLLCILFSVIVKYVIHTQITLYHANLFLMRENNLIRKRFHPSPIPGNSLFHLVIF